MRFAFQKRICCAITAIFAAWLSAPTAYCAGGAPVSVKTLVNSADAVVIAKILDGIVAQGVATLHLDVEKSLKGDRRPGSILSADCRLRGEAATYTTAIEKDRGLFFLRGSNGGWSILSATSGHLSSLRRAFFVLPSDSEPGAYGGEAQASVHERVVAELAGAFERGGKLPEGSGAVDFMWEYRSNPSPSMKALFSRLRASTHRALRTAGLCASLYDEDGLVVVEDGLGDLSAAEIRSITEEINYYLVTTDPKAIARLGRLAASNASPAPLRTASLRALAKAHNVQALQYLAEFLDDPDAEMRSLAVGGIAKFANNVPPGGNLQAPGPWKYRTYETLVNSAMDAKLIQDNPGIVAFWKAWWAEHRAELQ